jgi:nuclear GTP-binding protein
VPPSNEDTETDTVLKGVVRVENVKNPEDHIDAIIAKVNHEHLSKAYNGLTGWSNAEEFLAKLAQQTGKLLKGGEPDMSTVAKMVLNDWLRGKIPFFTPPPPMDGDDDGNKEVEDGEAKVEEEVIDDEEDAEGELVEDDKDLQ